MVQCDPKNRIDKYLYKIFNYSFFSFGCRSKFREWNIAPTFFPTSLWSTKGKVSCVKAYSAMGSVICLFLFYAVLTKAWTFR